MMKNAYGAPPGASSAGTGQFMPSYGAGAGVGANIGAVAGGPPSGRSRIVGAAESAWLQVGTFPGPEVRNIKCPANCVFLLV